MSVAILLIRPQAESDRLKNRQRWVDVAKGAVIVLVILGHVATYLESEGLLSGAWRLAGQALVTVRMPAFFLLSGLFASKALRQPIADLWSQRIYRFVYLFVVWSLLYIPVQMLFTTFSGLTPGEAAKSWAIASLKVDGFLWYFAALAAFFLLAWLIRGVDARVQLTLSFALSALAGGGIMNSGSFGVDHMAQYFFYFLAGCHLSVYLRSFAERATWLRLIAMVGGWAVAGFVFFTMGGGWIYAANVLLPLLAVPAALLAARLIEGAPGSRLLESLGKLTLPVFVLHPAFVIFSCAAVAALAPSGLGAIGDIALPLVITILVLLSSLLLHRALRRFAVLFEPPSRFGGVRATNEAGPSRH